MSDDAPHGELDAAVCVAPTYPEWAATEDGDWVWVRLDLADRAEQVAAVVLDCDLPRPVLDFHEVRFMWLDRDQTEWSEEWLLREVTEDADEAVAYAYYEVAEDDRTVCEGCEKPIDGPVTWADMDPFCAVCVEANQ